MTPKLLTLGCFCMLMNICHSQGIVISSGGNLVMNGSPTLAISDGGFSNSGNFVSGTGKVSFTGAANSTITTIGGSSTTQFYDLSINKSLGSTRLQRSVAIANSLSMLSANLDLNSFNVDLGNTGNILNESASSAIIGSLGGTVNRTINITTAINALNPGNIGVEITSASILGLTTIKRGEQQQVSGSGFSINRYYDIVPANNTNLNATVKMYYFDAELAGINESQLKLWVLNPAPGNFWKLLGSDAQDATNNWVSKNGVNELYRFTLASSVANPLPIALLNFSAQLQAGRTKLDWSTSFEQNNHHFDIERSADGRNFLFMGMVASNGNTASGSNYTLIDASPFDGITYYRLKQVNNDNSFTYSKVVAVNKGAYSNALVGVYPNPIKGPVDIRFTSSENSKKVLVQIVDGKGLIVGTKQLMATKGLNTINMNLQSLPQGTYYLHVIGIDSKAFTLIKD